MNFILTEMTFWRYFMPLIIEANNRNITCNVFIKGNSKYNNPLSYRNILEKHNKIYKFNIRDIKDINKYEGLTFLVEGCGVNHLSKKHLKVSITALCDYRLLYKNYIKKVDHVIFPSEKYATFYNCISTKNLYLGNPKYDITLDKKEICKQYNIPLNSKIATFMLPKIRDRNLLNTKLIIEVLRKLGYYVITKTRGKDPAQQNIHGDSHFLDTNWFPHTSMELIFVGDIMINTCSGAIKEAVMLRKPILNFLVKPRQTPQFLYEPDYCINIKPNLDEQSLTNYILKLTTIDYTNDFNRSIKENLTNITGNDSYTILEYFL